MSWQVGFCTSQCWHSYWSGTTVLEVSRLRMREEECHLHMWDRGWEWGYRDASVIWGKVIGFSFLLNGVH